MNAVAYLSQGDYLQLDRLERRRLSSRLQSGVVASVPTMFDVRVMMVCLAGFCVFLNVYATQTLLPLLQKIWVASKFEVSLTVSATTIGIALAAPLAGLLAERVGRRHTIAGAALLLTLPILLAATSPGLQTLIGWRFVQGLIMPGIIAVTMAYVADEWSGGGSAAVMGAYVTGNVMGGVTGRFLSGVIGAHLGWRYSFLALGLLNAAGALAIWFWLPAQRQATAATPLPATLRAMARHFHNIRLVSTFAVGAGVLFSLVAAFTYIPFYLSASPFHIGTVALSSLFLVYLVGIVVTPFGGRWVDRVGHQRALVMAALAAATGVAMTASHSLPLIVLGLAVCSSGIFICQSATASYMGHVAGAARSSAAGLYTCFYYTGGTLGAAVPAAAWAVGGWNGCVALILVVLLGAGAIALWCWTPDVLR